MAKVKKKTTQKPRPLIKAAKAAGMSVAEYAQKHKGDKGLKGQQARFYFVLQKVRKK
jgi:hypothetical protein